MKDKVVKIDSSMSISNFCGVTNFIEAKEVGETIEFIFKQTSNIVYGVYPPLQPEEKIFKIVYSCIDGKWNKSKPIYGRIIFPTPERYEFD